MFRVPAYFTHDFLLLSKMRVNKVLCRFASPKDPKFPNQIEFHRLPWKCLSPTSTDIHKKAASKYLQVLELARVSDVKLLMNDFHPEIDESRATFLLPGTVYIVPEVRSIFGLDPLEWGPYRWHGQHLRGSEFTMYYSSIDRKIASVEEIWEFVSTDRKLLCTAVCMSAPHVHCCPGSTLYELSKEKKDFVLFHFYNPNRPASELVQPLMKYFIHKPCLCSVRNTLANLGQWTPKNLPKRSSTARAAECASIQPPSSETWWDGIPERAAAYPGYCFGHRRDCWGMGI
ncbi:hypothetical protein XU18_2165 [Perkinsela sp. CCAP 1560/4]|nr:hypothetical protein XU18_2165 [Perkinsela sp. CCAP 1560/4]|eukprot:KNH07120.1 hypothetical protein XU18_2165 [Perkinsela sp. CCAP 1560/4]